MAAVTEKTEELGGKRHFREEIKLRQGWKRCHKRIFGNEIIISRVLSIIAGNLQGSVADDVRDFPRRSTLLALFLRTSTR